MFFRSFGKGYDRFFNAFIFTVHPVTLLFVYHSNFLKDGILVFWGDYEVSDGFASLEMHLDAILRCETEPCSAMADGIANMQCLSKLIFFLFKQL